MSDLNGTLAGLISSANEAKALGNIDDYNKAMNSLGELVATQANQGGKIYDTEASRGNYALMSEAQNAWLADPRNANTIRSWYAPKSSNSGSSTNTLPLTKSGARKVARATKSQPVQQTNSSNWVSTSSIPANLSRDELDISNLGYRRGSGRLANVFNGRDSLVTSNPYSVGSFNNLVNSTPSVEGVLNVLPDTVGVNNPEPETPFMNKPLVKQDGTLDLYDPDVPGPKLSIPLPRNISRHWNYGPFGIAWDAVGGALSYLNNLSGK